MNLFSFRAHPKINLVFCFAQFPIALVLNLLKDILRALEEILQQVQDERRDKIKKIGDSFEFSDKLLSKNAFLLDVIKKKKNKKILITRKL